MLFLVNEPIGVVGGFPLSPLLPWLKNNNHVIGTMKNPVLNNSSIVFGTPCHVVLHGWDYGTVLPLEVCSLLSFIYLNLYGNAYMYYNT